MLSNNDIRPTDMTSEVLYLGDMEMVHPEFNETNWKHIATVKAERTVGSYQHDHDSTEWHYTSPITKEIDPAIEGFWQWGDLLVRVIPDTILESGLYVFKTKGS